MIPVRLLAALVIALALCVPAWAQIPGEPGTRWGEPPAPARSPGERESGAGEHDPYDPHDPYDDPYPYEDDPEDYEALDENQWGPGEGVQDGESEGWEDNIPLEQPGDAWPEDDTWPNDAWDDPYADPQQGLDDPYAPFAEDMPAEDMEDVVPFDPDDFQDDVQAEPDTYPVDEEDAVHSGEEPSRAQDADEDDGYHDPREPRNDRTESSEDAAGNPQESHVPGAADGAADTVNDDGHADHPGEGSSEAGDAFDDHHGADDPATPEAPERDSTPDPDGNEEETENRRRGASPPSLQPEGVSGEVEDRRYDVFDYDESEGDRMWEEHDDYREGGRTSP